MKIARLIIARARAPQMLRLGICLVLFFGLRLSAQEPPVTLGPLFTDNMVIERTPRSDDRPFVWGRAQRGVEVSVLVGDSTAKIKAQSWSDVPPTNGMRSWVVTYKMVKRVRPLPTTPFIIEIDTHQRGKPDDANYLTNVVMGEIWLVVDPETGVKAHLPEGTPNAALSDVRWFPLAAAKARASNGWQVLNSPAAVLPDQSAVAAYWLDKMRSTRRPEPIGVLLLSDSNLKQHLAEHDLDELPKDLQKSRLYYEPFTAWRNAWETARNDRREKENQFNRDMISLKRRGKPMASETLAFEQLGRASIDQGDIPDTSHLHVEVLGVLH